VISKSVEKANFTKKSEIFSKYRANALQLSFSCKNCGYKM